MQKKFKVSNMRFAAEQTFSRSASKSNSTLILFCKGLNRVIEPFFTPEKFKRDRYKSISRFVVCCGCLLLLNFLFSCSVLEVSSSLNFRWPLKKYKLTQKFSPFKNPPHLGIDLMAKKGEPVFSSRAGHVVYAGRRFKGYGNVVMVEHSPHWASLYAHLQKIKVKVGQKVKQGALIGTVGNTGRASGYHLHFELFYKKKPINPLFHLP